MPYSGPVPLNPTRPILRDATVCSLANFPFGGSTIGTPASLIGVIDTVKINPKRSRIDTTASTDVAESSRAGQWKGGSITLEGFSASTGSALAAQFAAGAHSVFQFTEGATTGDIYVVLVFNEDIALTMGKEANKNSLTLPIEGVPYFGPAGGTLAPMVLD